MDCLPMLARSRRLAAAVMLGAIVALPAVAEPLATVPSVDLERYLGRWHQIAYYPNFFQRSCTGATTADYSKRADGMIGIVNACRTDGGETRAEGVARVVAPAKLEVRFAPEWLAFLPFVWGDYWVIDLAPDYSYAVVGAPGRDYLWILARAPQLDEAIYQRIVDRLPTLGYDPAKVVRTPP